MGRLRMLWVVILSLVWAIGASAQETKTFVAYSMKVAQARVEAAIKVGEDFRKKQPDLYCLGGITKPWAVVLDTKTSDWILVGERDPKSSVLTLDDWVVALRARFIHPERDPGVTIDPRPCDACRKAGIPCKHATKQDVRFFGGIEDTHFGQVCYEADWLMKKIGLGVERPPVEKLKTYHDLSVEQARNSGASQSRIESRFWFYPIVNRVNVLDDVVLLEQFQMGIFTEVLYAEVDGKPVQDVDRFEHYPSEGFSRSFSENYDEVAQAREVVETLRGLTRLAALAKGLAQTDGKLPLDFHLADYPLDRSKTPKEVEVLRVGGQEKGFEVCGGVDVMALVMRLKGGDLSALRDLVLSARPSPEAATWTFDVKTAGDQVQGVVMPTGLADPSEIAPMFAQAEFLWAKGRHDAAMECYRTILKLIPDSAEAHNNLGACLYDKGEYGEATAQFSESVALAPTFAGYRSNRAAAYLRAGRTDDAVQDCNDAIKLDPTHVQAYLILGNAQANRGFRQEAIAAYSAGLGITSRSASLLMARARAYLGSGDLRSASGDLSQALELDQTNATAWVLKAVVLSAQGREFAARDCLNQAAAVDPALAAKSHPLHEVEAVRRRDVVWGLPLDALDPPVRW